MFSKLKKLCAAVPLPSRGGVGGGVSIFLRHSYNLLYDPTKTGEHLFIAEAYNPYALLAEVRRPLFVIIVLMAMACTVKFDAQPMLGTIEVKDEWADALLAAKFQSTCATPLQCSPESCFSGRHIIAKSLALLFLFGGISLGGLVVHKILLLNNGKMEGLLFDYRPHPPTPPLEGRGAASALISHQTPQGTPLPSRGAKRLPPLLATRLRKALPSLQGEGLGVGSV